MTLLTKQNLKDLAANKGKEDQKPVVKFFGGGACTWLISEIGDDGDTMFGVCDLGMGCAELGYVSLAELKALRFPPFGLPVERDRYFKGDKTLLEYSAEMSQY